MFTSSEIRPRMVIDSHFGKFERLSSPIKFSRRFVSQWVRQREVCSTRIGRHVIKKINKKKKKRNKSRDPYYGHSSDTQPVSHVSCKAFGFFSVLGVMQRLFSTTVRWHLECLGIYAAAPAGFSIVLVSARTFRSYYCCGFLPFGGATDRNVRRLYNQQKIWSRVKRKKVDDIHVYCRTVIAILIFNEFRNDEWRLRVRLYEKIRSA